MRCGILSHKKGLSEIIGYVLLISITMILSVIVYQWIKTYVPKDAIECDEGVSIFVEDYNYDCTGNILDLTVKNNGRFDIAGYFIHATTSEEQEIAVTDISQKVADPSHKGSGSVLYPLEGKINPISTERMISDTFNLASIGSIFSIQLVPLRYQEIDGKTRPAACSNGKITQKLECAMGTTGGGGAVCGDGIITGTETCDQGGGNVANGDGCSSTCQIETGWSCVNDPMPSVCRKDVFVYLFSSTNPLNDGWTSECPVGQDCGGSAIDDIKTEINVDSCNIDSSCGSYYMITKDDRAAIKRIDATNYKNLILTYYRRSRTIDGTGDQIMVEWKLSTDSIWRTPPIEQTSATSLGSWTKNTFNFPSTTNGQQVDIKFWLNDGNTEHVLWDSMNVTGAKL